MIMTLQGVFMLLLLANVDTVGYALEYDAYKEEKRALQSNRASYHLGGKGAGSGSIKRRRQRLKEVLPDDMDAWAFKKMRRGRLQQQRQSYMDDSTTRTTIDPATFTTLYTQQEIADAKGAVPITEARSRCEKRFSKRRFYKEHEQRPPPVLYTFPGAGNTWCRLLAEYATGILTGSVYDDPLLGEILPGEVACSKQVTMIKVHPHTHGFLKPPNPIGVDKHFQTDNNKCAKGLIRGFSRGIWLIRDPYESIWSEYQRRYISQTELSRDLEFKLNSHVKSIHVNKFDFMDWYVHAAELAHQYINMWIHYRDMKSVYGNHNILVMRYENLRNDTQKIAELQRLIDFLHIRTTNERLHCAYLMATAAKRNATKNSLIDVDTTIVTKEDAYTEELACEMWQLFHQHAIGAGYSQFRNDNCSDYFPIIRPQLPKKNGENFTPSKEQMHQLAKAIAVGKRRRGASPSSST